MSCEVTDDQPDEVDLIGRRRGAIKECGELCIDGLLVETHQRADKPSQPLGVFDRVLDVFRSARRVGVPPRRTLSVDVHGESGALWGRRLEPNLGFGLWMILRM